VALLSGCGGGSAPKKTETAPGPPAFRPLPAHVTVSPRRGGPSTTFRIRIRTRAFVGVRARARVDYQLRVLRRPLLSGCITDTGPTFPRSHRRPLQIVLDPRRQDGGRWCRGSFRGTLTYYSVFACPDKGVCRPPKDFPRRSHKVARVAFGVR
jgi:hypothetical protein